MRWSKELSVVAESTYWPVSQQSGDLTRCEAGGGSGRDDLGRRPLRRPALADGPHGLGSGNLEVGSDHPGSGKSPR